MKYFIGALIFISTSTVFGEKPKVDGALPATLMLSFEDAVLKQAPEISTSKNHLFEGNSAGTALNIFTPTKYPPKDINNLSKIEH